MAKKNSKSHANEKRDPADVWGFHLKQFVTYQNILINISTDSMGKKEQTKSQLVRQDFPVVVDRVDLSLRRLDF